LGERKRGKDILTNGYILMRLSLSLSLFSLSPFWLSVRESALSIALEKGSLALTLRILIRQPLPGGITTKEPLQDPARPSAKLVRASSSVGLQKLEEERAEKMSGWDILEVCCCVPAMRGESVNERRQHTD